MCGICGTVSFGSRPDPDLVSDMVATLTHRGPDDCAVLVDHAAVLGHTRLALIDVEGGAQPLTTPDRSVWVTFNGEIFNYVELAQELRALGHVLTTASDTEVIAHAYEEWGSACFERFNGQWAVGLWDRRRQRLVLARDRMGILPLFYRCGPRSISFASRVATLLADPAATREFDPVGLQQVWTFWCSISPRTAFAAVSQLPPGHVATFDSSGLRTWPYWSAEFPPRGQEPHQDLQENAEELRALLVRATRLRFERSDFPVGAYLSGGLDSAVTAAAIRHFTDVELTTFSLRFTTPEFDEGSYQQLVADRLGTTHHSVDVAPSDIAEVFPDVVWHAEAPLLRTAPAPLFLLSRLVRANGYKVVVTGEGADEILGGYDIYREARVREFWARDQGSRLRDDAVQLLYPWMALNPAQAPSFARHFFGADLDLADLGLSHRPRWASTAALQTMLAPTLRERLSSSPAVDPVEHMPASASGWDRLSRAQWLEMTTLLPGYILARRATGCSWPTRSRAGSPSSTPRSWTSPPRCPPGTSSSGWRRSSSSSTPLQTSFLLRSSRVPSSPTGARCGQLLRRQGARMGVRGDLPPGP
ncbi:asparagine synthase (glutamine-hydrolyzing) [Ornithinimicrobium sp. CNJ-824]|uniref:asparagine synthase (glutamine-hydrolyzing) n=1 Tax=Ornithinimicrobium sp. CNJ-824 TaxID=1904966 RepID=UPI00095AEA35|nr:asparagine synthase (glutamine-hydrolyzing) [Ornithinimicrobium sp. CNJ-824]OLT21964.1 asparagine synthase (glutamine-hydrolyzing) [Ornithinimicrobium sp. CNJ-824]